jgi:hypothetical protein
MACIGRFETVPLLSLIYLAVFAGLFTLLAMICMRRRLIK